MLIRKQFKFEMAHIVRKAWSKRCSQNIHGHSYLLELFIEGNPNMLDESGMIIDFGLVKEKVNHIIDMFDHAVMLWDIPEDKEFNEFFKKNNSRWISSPYPTTAEMQSKIFYHWFKYAMDDLLNTNIKLDKVRIHETKTGWAEYNQIDFGIDNIPIDIMKIELSEELNQQIYI